MSSLRNPKSLADWLQLDYFRRPRPLKALWKPVVLATLAIGVAAMVAVAALQKRVVPRLATAYQAGPLSSSHAMFNNDCGTCHREAFQTWNRLWQFNGTIRAVSDETCQKCHLGDIHPVHHDTQIRNDNCVSCHREHHARIPLNRVPDSYCTSCHANLSAAVKAGYEVRYHEKISDFAGHPPFKDREDPGTIKFNHAVHLQKGGVPTPASRATANQKLKDLQCSTCHVSDEAGRLMKPIQYKDHCQECHPLTVGVVSGLATKAATSALEDFRKTAAPHQAPEVVRAALRDRLTLFIQNNPLFLQAGPKVDSPRPIPGTRPARPEVVARPAAPFATPLPNAIRTSYPGMRPRISTGSGCRTAASSTTAIVCSTAPSAMTGPSKARRPVMCCCRRSIPAGNVMAPSPGPVLAATALSATAITPRTRNASFRAA
jgi:hypothetical protein